MALNFAGLQAQADDTIAKINAAIAALQSGTSTAADQATIDALQAQLKTATDALANAMPASA